MKKEFSKDGIMSLVSMRRLVQLLSCIVVIAIGIKFYLFVSHLEAGTIPGFERPPGVEAFLPISALVSLKHLLYTGTINTIHPSALVIFLIVCMTALVVKKGFCSWVCPIGLLSDFIAKLHLMVFKKKVILPASLDLMFRSMKYGVAVFFVWSIFIIMPIQSVENFIQSPYNRFVDIRMLQFFTNISDVTIVVLGVLALLSFVVPYFWCRYLCPYGAVLSVISFFSFGKIKRNPSNCTNCGKCEEQCPGQIKIRKKESINSTECTACLTCVKTCPEEQAIGFSMLLGKVHVGQAAVAVILLVMFTLGISAAKLTGNWQNEITKQQYLKHVVLSSLAIKERKQAPPPEMKDIDPEKLERMMEAMKKMQPEKTPQAPVHGTKKMAP